MIRSLIGRLVGGGFVAMALGVSCFAAPQVERLYGVDYSDVDSLASRAGLTQTWLVPQAKIRLADKDTRLEFEADTREIELDGLRLFLGEPAVANRRAIYISCVDRDRFLLPILAPQRIPGQAPRLRTIVIDPGHGGKDDGAINAKLKLREKALALDVAQRLEKLLKAAGYQVVLTRRRDTFIPLPLRPTHANKVKADLFVSIHFNALDNKAVSGSETYILTPQYQRSTSSDKRQPDDKARYDGNASDPWNAVLGFKLHGSLVRSLQTLDRGMKHARFAVLRDLQCPGVLVEGGYITNDAEARKIGTPEWRQKLAQAIADGVADYRAALNGARR